MKKIIKPKRVKKVATSNHSGVALLLCFVIAGVAVAVALRQMALERKLTKDSVEQSTINKVAGEYTVTTSVGKLSSHTIYLKLSGDRKVKLISTMQGDDKTLELAGSWSGDSNGTIITSFKDKVYAFSYTPDGTGALRLLNPDVELWGAATLTLTRK